MSNANTVTNSDSDSPRTTDSKNGEVGGECKMETSDFKRLERG
jgi:hypothetical protein